MKTTKITSIILAVIMIFSAAITMAGCGKKDKGYYSDSFSTIKWPDSTLGKMLPSPESTTGSIETDRSDWLDVYIGDTTQDQYDSYVSQCKEKGITENYDSGTIFDNTLYYRAENSNGYRLEIEYHKEDKPERFHPLRDTMRIELQTPYVEETVPTTEKPTEKPTQKPTEKPTEKPLENEPIGSAIQIEEKLNELKDSEGLIYEKNNPASDTMFYDFHIRKNMSFCLESVNYNSEFSGSSTQLLDVQSPIKSDGDNYYIDVMYMSKSYHITFTFYDNGVMIQGLDGIDSGNECNGFYAYSTIVSSG